MRNLLNILLAPVVLLTGCSPDSEVATNTANWALDGDNGISLNGISLNGISSNGISLNGISLNGISSNGISSNGISLNGISLNGISSNGISSNGISLNGISSNGISLNGTDFIGATLSAVLSNGGTLALRIDDIDPLDGDNADVPAYEIWANGDSGWVPLCGHETDGSVRRALAVAGTWDQTGAWRDSTGLFSFACRRASIAKCIEFGYKPWLGYGDHHLACVRMLRADYCGDGTAHTVNGTPINLYDSAGIQDDTESWRVDAEWGPGGALCINHHRGSTVPSCYAEKYNATCGSFASGTLLINEYDGP
jgi:hypothetical protein